MSSSVSAIRTALIGLSLLLSAAAAAQEIAELEHLVLEPVARSTAVESPFELGASAPGEERALLERVDGHLEEIEALRRGGASNPAIIEQLAFLGVAYQGLERHEEAIETLDEAIALTVEDSARDNLQQIPLQEQKIPSYLALGDYESVNDTEELVYSLKESGYLPGSREMYFATINLADWYTADYFRVNYQPGRELWGIQRAVFQRAQRSIAGGGIPIFDGSIKDVGNQDINDIRLRRAENLYRDFQVAVRDSGNAQLDIMVDIGKRVARLAYVTKLEMDFERDNPSYVPNYDGSREQALRNSPQRLDVSYRMGREALEYVLAAMRSVDGVPAESLAVAILDLADWHLAYGQARAAEDAYRDAYEALLDAGFTAENIDIALATELPLQIPVFATHLYSRSSRGIAPDAELDYQGYVDVEYSVDDLGNAEDLRFLGRSAGDASRVERFIEIKLKQAKFRPVLSGGELRGPGRVEVRYYYTY